MELKEGMYVRTDKGLIDKILLVEYAKEKREQYPDHPSKNHWRDKFVLSRERYWRTSQNIIKASYNIIDLLEVGDVIVGKDGHKFEVYAIGSDCVYINGLQEFILIDGIKAIVTKEQFEREEYKL